MVRKRIKQGEQGRRRKTPVTHGRSCVCPETPTGASQLVLLRQGKRRSSKLESSDAVCRWMRSQGNLPQEEVTAIHLDNQNQVLGTTQVARGGRSASHVDPAPVFQAALLMNASRVILIHNHPSGDPTPSPNDVALTERVSKAGKLVGVALLDHVIVGESECTSLRDLGILRDE